MVTIVYFQIIHRLGDRPHLLFDIETCEYIDESKDGVIEMSVGGKRDSTNCRLSIINLMVNLIKKILYWVEILQKLSNDVDFQRNVTPTQNINIFGIRTQAYL